MSNQEDPRSKILEKVKNTPSINTTAVKVLNLLLDPNVSTKDLLDTIEYDPGLTSNILRLANSAYFGAPRSISTLRQAVVRLGTNTILQLVMTCSVSPVTQRAMPAYELERGELWRHSVAVGLAAEYLAEELGLDPPGYTFTAGLLHDIGKIILAPFVNEKAGEVQRLIENEKLPFYIAERKLLGTDHPEVGAALLDYWNVPETIVHVIRWNHEPREYLGERLQVVDLVHAANYLCNLHSVGTRASRAGVLDTNTNQRLGFNGDVLEKTLQRTKKEIEGLSSVFSTHTAK